MSSRPSFRDVRELILSDHTGAPETNIAPLDPLVMRMWSPYGSDRQRSLDAPITSKTPKNFFSRSVKSL